MASHNKFPGYVSAPKQLKHRDYRSNIRLDFNHRIQGDETVKCLGFSLRMFVEQPDNSDKPQPEIGVHLRPEEWLDLIEAMKEEYRRMERACEDAEVN